MKDKYIELLKDLGFYPVDNILWNVIEINHKTPENDLEKKHTEDFLKNQTGNKRGIYIYESLEKEILYVGKGNPIANRLISHYIESFQSVPGDKTGKWHRFFKAHKGLLRVYWKELDGEKERQVVEKMLDMILCPKFNEFNIASSAVVQAETATSIKKDSNKNISLKTDIELFFVIIGKKLLIK